MVCLIKWRHTIQMTKYRPIHRLNYQWKANIHFIWPMIGQYDAIFYSTIKSFQRLSFRVRYSCKSTEQSNLISFEFGQLKYLTDNQLFNCTNFVSKFLLGSHLSDILYIATVEIVYVSNMTMFNLKPGYAQSPSYPIPFPPTGRKNSPINNVLIASYLYDKYSPVTKCMYILHLLFELLLYIKPYTEELAKSCVTESECVCIENPFFGHTTSL